MSFIVFNRKLLLVVFSLVAISACSTSLIVKKLPPKEEGKDPEGVVYYLPKTEFNIGISRELKSCPYYLDGNVYVDIDSSFIIDTSNMKDLDNSYLIEYDSLRSITKEYEIEIQLYGNGFIKSINSSVNDKSSDIVQSVAGAAASIAFVSAAGPTGLAVLAKENKNKKNGILVKNKNPVTLCTDGASQAIEDFKIYSKKIKVSQKLLSKKVSQVNNLVLKIKEATGEEPNENYLNKAISELKSAHDVFTLDKNKLAEAKSILLIKDSYNFSSTSSYEMKIKKNNISKWIISTPEEYLMRTGVSEEINPESKLYEEASDVLNKIKKSIEKQTTFNFSSPDLISRGKKNISVADGIIYRQGALVDVHICKFQGCDDDGLIRTERVMVSDAGTVASLPFKNGPFQENAYEISFSKEGYLERVKLKSNSQASKSAGTLSNVAKQYYDYQTSKQKLEVAEDQATVKDLDTQIAILEKNNKLSELKTPVDEELKKIKREIELKTLLNNFDKMDTEKAQQELDRLVIQQKAEELLNRLE